MAAPTLSSEKPEHAVAIAAVLARAFGPGRFAKTGERIRERGATQGTEELPFLPITQPIDHRSHLVMFIPHLIARARLNPSCLSSPLNGGLCASAGP